MHVISRPRHMGQVVVFQGVQRSCRMGGCQEGDARISGRLAKQPRHHQIVVREVAWKSAFDVVKRQAPRERWKW